METEILAKLYLELSQLNLAKTRQEIELEAENVKLRGVVNNLADKLARYTGTNVPDEIRAAREGALQ